MGPPEKQRGPRQGLVADDRAAKHSGRRRKIKIPSWITTPLRPVVREAAARGGLKRVAALVFLEVTGGRAHMVYAIPRGELEGFADDPWPAAVYRSGGSLLLVFEDAREARELHDSFNSLIGAAQRIVLATTPAAGEA